MRKILIPPALVLPSFTRAASAERSIVGDWYEDKKQDGVRTIGIARMRANGTFIVEFRRCIGNDVDDLTHTGHWTYVDRKLRMVIEAIDGAPSFIVTDYETESNDGRTWDYRLIDGGPEMHFHDVRVTADSKMPGCDTTS